VTNAESSPTFFLTVLQAVFFKLRMPLVARPRAWICGGSHAGIVGSNPAGDKDYCLVSVVCCLVEVSETG
jgi:hypothetical protein